MKTDFKIGTLKIFSLLVLIGFILSVMSQSIIAITLPSTGNGSIKDKIITATDDQFAEKQAKMIKTTDKLLEKLDKMDQKIDSNENLDDSEKAEAKATIEGIRVQVEKYQEDINAATNMDELRTVNQELLKYLKENKEQIKKTAAKVIFNSIEYSIPIIEEYITVIEEDVLPMLKKMCPDNTAEITELESQLSELKVLLDKLEAFAESYNPDVPITKEVLKEHQKELIEAITLMKAMTVNVKTLQTECLG